MIYDDYIEFCDKYKSLYGDNTIVLMQVGDFFELYGIQNDDEVVGANMYAVGDICNIIVTRKNKSIIENSRQNPLMAGFPLYALPKHSQSLLDNGYTVVIIRQVTPPPNVRREVTEILSPSMNITPTSNDSNFLVAYYWEKGAMGVAGVDVSTGQTFVYEASGVQSFVNDEAFRILQAYQPREVILSSGRNFTAEDIHDIESLLNATNSHRRVFHKLWHYNLSISKLAYQNEVVAKVYKTDVPLFDLIGIERKECARCALVQMLIFAFEHNELIMKNIQLPTVLHNDTFMTLEYNSAVQLNIIGCFADDKPLISLLNKCCTAIGSRLFRTRLLCPLINPQDLEVRYARIEDLIQQKVVVIIRKTLQHVGDIERQFRKIQLLSLSPLDFYSFHNSLEHIKNVATYDYANHIIQSVNEVQSAYTNVLLLDDCAKYTINDIKSSIFCTGVYEEIDAIMTNMNHAHNFLATLAENITAIDDTCICRVESNERDGYFLQMTKKRWETVKSKCPTAQHSIIGVPFNELVAKPISSGSTVVRLSHDTIDEASNTILSAQRKLSAMVLEKYKEFLQKFSNEFASKVQTIIEYVADIDVATTNAFIASEYGYCKPMIDVSNPTSFIEIENVRHPIIEQLSRQTAYVGNDVTLSSSGMLLYGINASGKSSLMKAIGLAVVMAQAGMYVAAQGMRFRPYRHLFTRITSMDNIYRGMSTFIVEMAELRNILQRADASSLVIGDELCAGTESISAVAIVAAGIQTLLSRSSSFIFATHLHELSELECLSSNVQSLHIYHMHIETDPETGKIIYDRRLRPGTGSSLYGLEVCNSLGMPSDFIKSAFAIRRQLSSGVTEIVRNKWSRYNASVCMDMCKVCRKNTACDVHHIHYQHTADDDNFVKNGLHKNDVPNLVPLCKECHTLEHNGSIKIYGYRDTSSGGSELHFELSPRTPIKNSTKDEVIASLKKKYKYESHQWYQCLVSGKWRKCKIDTVLKEAQRSYKYTFSEEDIEDMKYCMGSCDTLQAASANKVCTNIRLVV